MRLPVPMNEYLPALSGRNTFDVTLELRTGNTTGAGNRGAGGELDAPLLADTPSADAPFDKVPIYDEELVIVAGGRSSSDQVARDAKPQAVLAFESGCSYRQRLQDWFAHHGEMPDRIVEISSYHAMLAAESRAMGISLLPRNVPRHLPRCQSCLSVHSLPPVD